MKMSNDKLYFNKPQLLSALICANEEYHVLGRGVGKSSGILAYRTHHNFQIMPRSSGFNVAESFQQLLTRTLPSLVAGWQKLGFYRDVHYVIGKRPDKKWQRIWNWREPYEPPVSYDRYIATCYGSGMNMISQDVVGNSLGLNTDWGIGDEAKNLNYEQFCEETLPTMRANKHHFGHLAEHWSLVFTTSRPSKDKGKWIEDKMKEMDEELIHLILQARYYLDEKRKQLLITPEDHAIIQEIEIVEKNLNELRKKCVFYQEASTLENIHALGIDYIKKMKRILPEALFDIEILNLKQGTIKGGYYPAFDVGRHTCRPVYNNTYLESLNYNLQEIENLDCRQDADLAGNLPLRIAVDWGGHMNYMSIAQEQGIYYKFIKELWVKAPEGYEHLARLFVRYYKHHRTKKLEFLYDHTGNTTQATGKKNADEFAAEIKSIDPAWEIEKLGDSAAPTQHEKYKMNWRAMHETNPRMQKILIVDGKCEHLISSIQQAPLKERTDKRTGDIFIEKDKSSERKFKTIDPLDATHPSDTFDLHIASRFKILIEEENYYAGL